MEINKKKLVNDLYSLREEIREEYKKDGNKYIPSNNILYKFQLSQELAEEIFRTYDTSIDLEITRASIEAFRIIREQLARDYYEEQEKLKKQEYQKEYNKQQLEEHNREQRKRHQQ